jgi:hypothetical protein
MERRICLSGSRSSPGPVIPVFKTYEVTSAPGGNIIDFPDISYMPVFSVVYYTAELVDEAADPAMHIGQPRMEIQFRGAGLQHPSFLNLGDKIPGPGQGGLPAAWVKTRSDDSIAILLDNPDGLETGEFFTLGYLPPNQSSPVPSLSPSGLPRLQKSPQDTAALNTEIMAINTEATGMLVAAGLLSRSTGIDAGAAAGLLTGAAALLQFEANTLAKVAADPIDPNFTQVALVVANPPAQLAPGPGLTAATARAFHRFAANAAQVIGVCDAISIAMNRAQGAALAGASDWEGVQLEQAGRLTAQLASLESGQPAILKGLVATVKGRGGPRQGVGPGDVQAFQAQVERTGLPTSLSRLLARLGAGEDDLNAIAAGVIALNPATPAGTYPEVLSRPGMLTAVSRAAGAFRKITVPVVATGVAVDLTRGSVEKSVVIANLTDPNPRPSFGKAAVSVDWGDGVHTRGILKRDSGHTYSISGRHAYAATGMYTIMISVRDRKGETVGASSVATVS